MKRFYALILLVGLVLPMTGCFHNQIIVEKNYNASATEPDWRKGFQMYLLWGLVPLGENPIDLSAICPQGAGIVDVKWSFVDGLLNHLLLGGILTFQDVAVTCARAPAANAGGTGGNPLASN